MGSSSSSMSGRDSSSLQSATRRFSPPDRGPILASQGGRRRASAAISSWVSMSAPLVAMMFSYFAWKFGQFVEIGVGLGVGGVGDLLELLLGLHHLAEAGLDFFADGLVGVEPSSGQV